MIIKATRISTASGHGAIANHVLRGKDNERITHLRGGEADLVAAFNDARAWKRKKAIRHFAVSPAQKMTRKQANECLQLLAQEFGFDPQSAVVIEHQKPRTGEGGYHVHWHILAPEVDPITGATMGDSHMYARQEKIARVCEVRFGHPITQGRHNRAVVHALRNEGLDDIAGKLEAAGITEKELPNASYTSEQHQIAKRQGLSLPKVREVVKTAWERSDSRQALEAALAECSLQISDGDKPNTWIVQGEDGEFLGGLHRLAGVRKAEIAKRMQAAETIKKEQAPPPANPIKNNPTRVAPKGRRKGIGAIKPPWIGQQIRSKREAAGLAHRWQQQGFKAEAHETGVLIHGNGWQIADSGNKCVVSHPAPDAIKALVSKGKREWNGQIEAHGSQEFLAKCWLECQRQGVQFSVQDQPNWKPPKAVQKHWERERGLTPQQMLDRLTPAQIEIIRARLEGRRPEQPKHHHQPEPEQEAPTFRM